MSNYSKITDFAAKDELSTGNPAKIVKGTEIDDELLAISGAISSKADLSGPTFTGTPSAPTATAGTNTTQIATTAFTTTAVTAVAIPTGALLMWPKTTAPTGYLKCNGAAVSRTTYADLYSAIGTTYGSGDGSTTFNVPDFDNRFPVGYGDLYSMAATGGSRDAVLPTNTISTEDLTGTLRTDGGITSANGVFTEIAETNPYYIDNSGTGGAYDRVDLDVSHTHTIVGASQTFTAATTDLITMGTGWDNNMAVKVSTTGTLPSGLSSSTTYYIVQADVTAKTCKFSTSVGGSAVDIASTGSGTHTMTIQEQSGVQRNLPPYLAIAFIIKT